MKSGCNSPSDTLSLNCIDLSIQIREVDLETWRSHWVKCYNLVYWTETKWVGCGHRRNRTKICWSHMFLDSFWITKVDVLSMEALEQFSASRAWSASQMEILGRSSWFHPNESLSKEVNEIKVHCWDVLSLGMMLMVVGYNVQHTVALGPQHVEEQKNLSKNTCVISRLNLNLEWTQELR